MTSVDLRVEGARAVRAARGRRRAAAGVRDWRRAHRRIPTILPLLSTTGTWLNRRRTITAATDCIVSPGSQVVGLSVIALRTLPARIFCTSRRYDADVRSSARRRRRP